MYQKIEKWHKSNKKGRLGRNDFWKSDEINESSINYNC